MGWDRKGLDGMVYGMGYGVGLGRVGCDGMAVYGMGIHGVGSGGMAYGMTYGIHGMGWDRM